MRITERDVRLMKDMALSHVLSRDQILTLGYYGSVSRVNFRLKALRDAGLIRVLATPFFAQSLYVVCKPTAQFLGERIARLIRTRAESPRFLQHALATTNVRIAHLKLGATAWRFEQQLTTEFRHAGRTYEVRPDGMAIFESMNTAVEVDMGHVAPTKFVEKLKAYEAFARSGELESAWRMEAISLTICTTGHLRARRLAKLAERCTSFPVSIHTFAYLGCSAPGGWS